MQFLSVRSNSPYRITIVTDVSPDLTASDYVLSRADNGSLGASISHAFLAGTNTVELTISNEGLIDGIVYNIALPGQPGAPSSLITYRQPLYHSQVPIAPNEDPEAEAFGLDIDWLADALSANGDTPTVRGKQCLINDLAVLALIQKGEIFHRPNAGAGVQLNVNGPMTNATVQQVTGAIKREWYKDARVKDGGVTIRAEVGASTGRLTIFGEVLPIAIDEPLVVKLPGGGT